MCSLGVQNRVKGTGMRPARGAGMLMIFRSTSDRMNRLSNDSCQCAHWGCRTAREIQSGTHNLSKSQLTGWTDCPETATSVLTGGAEPQGVQSGTHNLSICQLTGWTDCQMAAADVLIGGAEPRGKVLQFGLTIF